MLVRVVVGIKGLVCWTSDTENGSILGFVPMHCGPIRRRDHHGRWLMADWLSNSGYQRLLAWWFFLVFSGCWSMADWWHSSGCWSMADWGCVSLQWLVIKCRLGLNPVAVDQWRTGWSSSVTCLLTLVTGSYRCSCQRIAPPGLSTIDAAPVVPVFVDPVFDPRWWSRSCGSVAVNQEARAPVSVAPEAHSSPSSICRSQQFPDLWPAAPAVSVAYSRRLQYLLLLRGGRQYLLSAAPEFRCHAFDRLQWLSFAAPAMAIVRSTPVAVVLWTTVAAVAVAPVLLIDSSGCRSSGSSGCCSSGSSGCRSIDSGGTVAVVRSTPVAVLQ